MDLAVDLALALIGLVLIVVAAERLVAAAVGTALALRVTPFVVTAFFIGFDPENLAVGAAAANDGSDGIALGSILGAAVVAIALAFGLTALVTPVRVAPAPWPLLALRAAAVAGFAVLASDGELSRTDGVVLILGYAAAVVTTRSWSAASCS
jgi:cation:H+ antiporter